MIYNLFLLFIHQKINPWMSPQIKVCENFWTKSFLPSGASSNRFRHVQSQNGQLGPKRITRSMESLRVRLREIHEWLLIDWQLWSFNDLQYLIASSLSFLKNLSSNLKLRYLLRCLKFLSWNINFSVEFKSD